jgi:chemotaxis protein methyltransferase CheR
MPNSRLLEEVRRLVLDYAGILLDRLGTKNMEERLHRHMEDLGVKTVDDYLFLLKAPSGGAVRDDLMSRITVSESFFFRNPNQFRYLATTLLPKLLNRTGLFRGMPIRIWSAGCSTGEEPYSLAHVLRWFKEQNPHVTFQITATDINATNIEKARTGRYRDRSLRDKSREFLHEFPGTLYFETDGGFQVTDEIRHSIQFKVLNLKDIPSLKSFAGSDIIMCRNVMIYFEDRFRETLLHAMHDALNPDGMLFFGETESLTVLHDHFELVGCQGAFGYRKRAPGVVR